MRREVGFGIRERAARALPIFDHIPPGHTVHTQHDGRHWPHIREGETAVIDCADREIVLGELFLIAQRRGPALWLLRRDPWQGTGSPQPEPTVYLDNLNAPSKEEWREFERTADLPPWRGLWTADGSIYVRALEPLIIGRCVGLFEAPAFVPPAKPDEGRAR